MKLLSDISPRLYQQTIFATTVTANTLVVLPTGLGKTVIALLDIAHFLQTCPTQKIVFLAPTKPLCDQHQAFIQKHLTLLQEEVILVTGTTAPQKRQEMYQKARVIIATPQGFENDIISHRISLEGISLIIFDEAHRGVGNYSYTFIADRFRSKNKTGRIVALTASPGSDKETIMTLCSTLGLEKIEARTEEDTDVKQYVNEIKTEFIEVALDEALHAPRSALQDLLKTKARELKGLGIPLPSNLNRKQDLLALQSALLKKAKSSDKDFETLQGISFLSELLKIQYVVELLETQGVRQAYGHMKQIYTDAKQKKTKSAQRLAQDIAFGKVFVQLQSLSESNLLHPKQRRLLTFLKSYYDTEENRERKVILFTQFRDTASELERYLNENLPVTTHLFLGQSKKNGTGFSQKKQKEIIDDFRNNKFQILLSTSIGEEGLDIPRVDTVLFYEPIPSAIRTIQRRGRTGRHAIGSMCVFVTKQTRDEAYRWVAHRKEKNMHSVLDGLKSSKPLSNQTKKEQTLDLFDGKVPFSHESSSDDPLFEVTVDVREKNSTLTKELVHNDLSIKLKRLDVADYIISSRIGIEFKTCEDFIGSIIDKRIFEQLRALKSNFSKPLLIIQGTEDIYSLRQISPAVIYGLYYTITVQYGIPLLWTKDEKETASVIAHYIKKEHQEHYGSLYTQHAKKPKQTAALLEYVVSSLPFAGPQIAMNLLTQFGTIERIVQATEEELIQVPLIGAKTAHDIYLFFRTPYGPD